MKTFKRHGLPVVPENRLCPAPAPNPHVSPATFEESDNEQEDIIRITLVPQEASFDQDGEEILEFTEQAPETSVFTDLSEPAEVYRQTILDPEAILQEAEEHARRRTPPVDPHL